MSSGESFWHVSWTTDLGPLTALATSKGLAGLYLTPPDLPAEAARLAGGKGFELKAQPQAHLTAARDQLDRYLAGELRDFTVDLDLRGTPFQLSVWRALQQIPWGSVVTYGRLARMVGKPGASRAVGQANGANPVSIIVPCHRVVASNGLGGYGGGLAKKRILLGVEGVTESDIKQAGRTEA